MNFYITCSTPEETNIQMKIKAKNEQHAIQLAFNKHRITSIDRISTTRSKSHTNTYSNSYTKSHYLTGNTVTKIMK